MPLKRVLTIVRSRAATCGWRSICAGALLSLLATPAAYAYPAHYLVVSETSDGDISIVSRQLVEIAGTPDFHFAPPRPNALESQLEAVVHDKASGKPLFTPYAVSSSWTRGEFHAEQQIDGRAFALEKRLYVLRIPAGSGRTLRLQSVTRMAESTPGTKMGATRRVGHRMPEDAANPGARPRLESGILAMQPSRIDSRGFAGAEKESSK